MLQCTRCQERASIDHLNRHYLTDDNYREATPEEIAATMRDQITIENEERAVKACGSLHYLIRQGINPRCMESMHAAIILTEITQKLLRHLKQRKIIQHVAYPKGDQEARDQVEELPEAMDDP